jgi:polar amino acid transport system substrate-binding protein
MRRALVAIAAAVLLAGVAAGCGSSSNRAERMTLSALGIPEPVSHQSKQEPYLRCYHMTASLRPPAVMPLPREMPAGSFMSTIEHRGYLKVGVDQNTLHFAYFNPLTGQFQGFEIDLLQQLANAIFGNRPNDMRPIAITTGERDKAVRDGKVDLVADAYTITCYRRKLVDFSTVYYHAGQKLLVPKDSPIHSIKDLAGKRVCVTKHSTSLSTLERQAPQAIPHTVDQRTDCLVLLQQGKVDAITSDDAILLGFQTQDPDTHVVGSSFAPEPYGIAISQQHPEFVRFVNGVLEKLRHDHTWQAIYQRWLGKPVPAPPQLQYDG